jgi:heterodisulfide reductase subunit B
MPIVHLPQMVAHALGMPTAELGLKHHIVDALNLRKGAAAVHGQHHTRPL